MFLRRFAEDIVLPIELDGREHIDYVPTQVFTEYLRYAFPGDSPDGLVFSSARAQGRNYVLFCGPELIATQGSKRDDAVLTIDPATLTGHRLGWKTHQQKSSAASLWGLGPGPRLQAMTRFPSAPLGLPAGKLRCGTGNPPYSIRPYSPQAEQRISWDAAGEVLVGLSLRHQGSSPSAGSQRAAAMGSVVTWNRGMLTAAGSVEFYEDTGRRWLAENGL